MYRAAHLHIVSSRYESQCVAVLEAAAAGVPTVGTAVGILPALAPGAALAVAPGDADALADGVCRLLADQARRAAMGARAQAFARAHDARFTAAAFEAIYRRVAAPRAATTSR
jgi:glycosyltransferase involved in cell wall biosynthesis